MCLLSVRPFLCFFFNSYKYIDGVQLLKMMEFELVDNVKINKSLNFKLTINSFVYPPYYIIA
jgi:hypothetical protein